ncbi:MAG: amidohydrolase family protein [Candidatus Thorarchaeota archaeon]|jgi:predicted TIM-barrel fold metal-dependent hydrolase
MKSIDAHIHIAEKSWKFGADLLFDWKDLGQAFKEEKLDRAQIIPIVGSTDDSLAVNREFFNKLGQQTYKDRVWAFYWPSPNEVDFEFANRSDVAGIKYHPSISQVRIDQAPDVVNVAQDTGLPLLVHCGRNELSHSKYLLGISRINPDITFIAAHLGGMTNDLILITLDMIKNERNRDNVYLDTSGCMNPLIMRKAIDVMGDDRILFGTDLPFYDYEVSRFVLDQTGIEDSALRKILYENVVKLHRG